MQCLMKILILCFLVHTAARADFLNPEDFALEKYKADDRFFSMSVQSENYLSFSKEIENWGEKKTNYKKDENKALSQNFRKTFALGPYYYWVVSPQSAGIGRTLANDAGENSLAEYFVDFQKASTGERVPFLNFRGRNIRGIGFLGLNYASELSYRVASSSARQRWLWDFTIQTGPRYSFAKNWLLEVFASINFTNFLMRAGQMVPHIDIDGYSQKYGATLQVSALLGARWIFTLQQSYAYFLQQFREFAGDDVKGYVRIRTAENLTTVNVQLLL